MNRKVIIIAAIFALVAVVFGAFGAHILKESFDADKLSSFETAVRYQMFHALALLVIGLNTDKLKYTRLISSLMISGIVLFSCSIYLLCLQSIWGINLSFLGPITPLGGLLLIVSWSLLIVKNYK